MWAWRPSSSFQVPEQGWPGKPSTFPASSDCLSEVAPRELSPRTRLQVPLKFDRRCLFIELDRHQRSPWTMSGCVWRPSFVVCRQPGVRVGRDPHVILVWAADALQDVDESFGEDHAAATARCRPPRNSNDFVCVSASVAISALDQRASRSQWLQLCPSLLRSAVLEVSSAGLPAVVSRGSVRSAYAAWIGCRLPPSRYATPAGPADSLREKIERRQVGWLASRSLSGEREVRLRGV